MGTDIVARGLGVGAQANGVLRTAIPNVYNLKASNFSKWRKARSNAACGKGRAKLANWGPSTTAGSGAGTGVNRRGGMIPYSYPDRLAYYLNKVIPAEANSFFGTHNYEPNELTDPRITVGSSAWIGFPGGYATSALGGLPYLHQKAGDQSALVFTPTINYDNAVLYFCKYDNHAACDVKFGGTLIESVPTVASTSGQRALLSKAYNSGNVAALATPGKYAISFSKTISTANPLRVVGVECWNSTAPAISVTNFGAGGATTTDFVITTSNGGYVWSPIYAVPIYAPDLTILMPDTNGWFTGISTATMIANVTAMAAAARQSGDVMIVIFHPDPRSGASNVATQAEYAAALRALAITLDCPYLDLQERYVSPDQMVADGWTPAGDVHPYAWTYDDIAAIISRAVLA